MDTSNIVSRNPEIMFTELGDKIMAMSVETGNYHEFDPVGSAIWREIEQPTQIDSLCDKLCSQYNVTPERCLTELSVFLEELVGLDMVVVAGDSNPEI